MTLFKNRQLLINIFIGLGLISIPFLSSPDLGSGLEMLKIHGFQKSLFSYFFLLLFFYGNYYFIIPKFYITKRWLPLTLIIIICFLVVLKIPELVIGNRMGLPLHSVGKSIPPPLPQEHQRQNFIFNFFSREHYIYQFLGVFVLSLFLRINEHLNDMKNEKLISEVSYLKAQINPHFLFNTLNSIYALSLTKSDKAPNAILKLSDLMRHVVSESSQKYISLQKEVDYIKNFIDLQLLRLTENTLLDTNFTGDFKRYNIAPLLLISIIENAFKYGANANDISKIIINLSVNSNNLLILNVENMVVNTFNNNADSSTEKGLKNTIKQLKILYPHRHGLSIITENNKHKVNLTIQLE